MGSDDAGGDAGDGPNGCSSSSGSGEVIPSAPLAATPAEKLRGRAFWEAIGAPKFVSAPMVDQSELAFRMLCRRHGTELAYTPMLHGRLYATDKKYRRDAWSTCPQDRPLFVQFCGDDPETLTSAAKQLPVGTHDAVDLNCGCPQGIAKRGHYGAFLLTEKDLLESIVKRMDSELTVPVTAKIRLLHKAPDLQDTLNLASTLEAAGLSVLCVHGRTKEMKGQSVGVCDWDSIAAVRRRVNIPVIANGGIETYEDATRCLEATGCDAVMSSEALLEAPGLFGGPTGRTAMTQEDLALEYLELARQYSPTKKCVKAHLFHFLYAGLQLHTDLRSQLGCSQGIDEMAVVANALRARRAEERAAGNPWPDRGWYLRYRNPLGDRSGKKRKADELEATPATTEGADVGGE
eukprot:gnl/TRDRNA2_/TRDRNA2_190042_c0_seq1.p1 gnl/TRDRNA2_/TRDRNA2_190042_c0~~gnl/TRDRNA2_/TRDRNA2_190042_c0_seq1.p1  ORF type:complete len:417 (-),score=71.86 gnl/TRDRNA2_/TRDRNA2_190042_c0_seq1:87-1301(-)